MMKKLLTATLASVIALSSVAAFDLNASAAEQTETNSSIPEKVSTVTWNKTENFPDENGELRFWMDDLEDKLDTLTLTYIYDDGNKPIEGAKVAVYKIGTVSVKDGDTKYKLIDSLNKDYPNLNFAGMSSDELDKIANELANKDLKATQEITTDANGVAKFENLEHGFYLIKEQAKTGPAADYEYFKPFLLNVPFPDIENDKYSGHWIYEVEALPKTNIPTKKKLIIIPPQTGDTVNYTMFYTSIALFGLSVVNTAIVVYVLKRKKKKNE